MWFLRLLAALLLVAVGVGLLFFVLTGNRAYLVFAVRLFKYGIVFALLVFALMIIERVAIIPV